MIRDTLAQRMKLEFALEDGGSAQVIKISEEEKGEKQNVRNQNMSDVCLSVSVK